MPDPRKLKGWIVVWAAGVNAALLIASAGVHHHELGSPGYARSAMIHVEVLCLIGVALLLVAQPVMAIIYLVRRRFAGLAVVAAATALSVLAWLAAMALDGATLLHAT